MFGEKLGGRGGHIVDWSRHTVPRAPAVDFPHDRWEKIIALNMNAVFYMSQLAGKQCWQKYGKIINIASMTAFFASVLIPAYSASKGGVAQITKALSMNGPVRE